MTIGKRFGSGRHVPARSEDRLGFQGARRSTHGPESLSVFGVNCIKVRHGQPFFTNSDRNILARMLIEDDGTSRASAKVYGNFDSPDGFDFNRNGKVVIAQSEVDLLARVTGDSKVMLAGAVVPIKRPAAQQHTDYAKVCPDDHEVRQGQPHETHELGLDLQIDLDGSLHHHQRRHPTVSGRQCHPRWDNIHGQVPRVLVNVGGSGGRRVLAVFCYSPSGESDLGRS